MAAPPHGRRHCPYRLARRIVYRTVAPHGRPTTAGGLPALPRSGERRLRSVSFTHGTELAEKAVASVSTKV
ncbi:hypothetical protein AB0I49_11510 [Streptomyces sp. NPDC050617]|uniref:hypothetical protein n=1 Tax=Streptomyces sp. NPDC050617 TaxID=3154628 RepID=UPI0034220AB7